VSEFLSYSCQWIDNKDIESVVDVLKGDWITRGPKIEEFEKALQNYTGAKYVVVFSSGTAALHAAYFAAGIKSGNEIITSPISFVSTSNAALFLGAEPVFVDIELNTGNLDFKNIEKLITKKTIAIVPIHYGGHPVDLTTIRAIARYRHLLIIEDACHALGAKYFNEKIGSCRDSDMTIFSFHPLKSITTGEGGAITTNSRAFYKRLKVFRGLGITKDPVEFKVKNYPGGWYSEMQLLGYNYNLTDFQAALGISQLKKLDMFITRRREIARIYSNAFRDNSWFDIPVEKSYAQSAWHLYPIRLKEKYKNERKKIFNKLREQGLGVQVHYLPIYRHPYYQKLGYSLEGCPNAEDFYEREISIPIYPAMTDADIERVIKIIQEIKL